MLQKNMKPYFSSAIRSRGEGYFQSNKAKLSGADHNSAYFIVRGSEVYHCHFSWNEKAKKSRKYLFSNFDMSCTCPYFEGYGLCKHIWASLKEGDRQGVWSDFPGETQLVAGSSHISKSKKPGRKLWQRKIERLEPHGGRSSRSVRVQNQEIFYSLDLNERIKTVRFFKKKDSLLMPSAFRLDELQKIPESIDRELIWMLTSQAESDYYFRPSAGFDSGTIPLDLEIHLLKRLCETNRSFLETGHRNYNPDRLEFLEFDEHVRELSVDLSLRKEHVAVESELSFESQKDIPLDAIEQFSDRGYYVSGSTIGRFNEAYYDWVEALKGLEDAKVPKADKDNFVQALFSLENTPRISVNPNLGWKIVESGEPAPKMVIKNEGEFGQRSELYGGVSFRYGDGEVFSNSVQKFAIDTQKKALHTREKGKENKFFSDTEPLQLTPVPERFSNEYNYRIRKNDFISTVKTLVESGWEVEANGKKVEPAGSFDLSVTSGVDWFDLKGGVTFESGELITLPEMMKSLKSGEKFIQLGDGKVGMLPEDWLEKHAEISDLGVEEEGGALRFTNAQGLFLNGWFENDKNFKADKGFSDFQKKIARVTLKKKAKALRAFRGELRDYQEEGLSWLQYLKNLNFGGILADDMGLGKTVQIIALLQKEKRSNVNKEKLPSLIVVPKSLIYNWTSEIEKFAPNLSALVYFGGNRFEEISDAEISSTDIVITTYHTLRNDFDRLSSMDFNYMILDEAQNIKNPGAQISQACKGVGSRYRLALTGTPIENSVSDLFSILDFVNPGLVSEKTRQSFSKTIEGDGESLKKLSKALAPMILRRTKKQVLKELPEKVESTIKCELSKSERKQYNDLRKYYQLRLSKKIKEKGIGRAKMEILEALLRLRQAACHPALIDKNRINFKSAKLDVLFEQIHSLVSSGNKCLVFSQFTSFLQVVKPKLEKEKIKYLYLDGKTTKRKELVEEFENSDDTSVFLISLKAGGVGLNLTSANYVFILDPWWNPAAESQAIDRTYRMGQKKNVFAYKLIAKNTVEEKILELQKTKRELSDALINPQAGMLKKMSVNDLEFLLS